MAVKLVGSVFNPTDNNVGYGMDISDGVAVGFRTSGACTTASFQSSDASAVGFQVSGASTTAAFHALGDQAIGFLFDVDAAATDGVKFAIDTGIALTRGINIECTGTGTVGTGILMSRGITSGAIRIGAWKASAALGNAVVLADTMHDGVDTSQLDVVSVFGETVEDLTSAYSAKVGRFRHLINTSDAVAQETYGLVGQIVVKSADLSHYHGGIMGTVEGNTAFTISTSYGVGAVVGRVGATGVTVDSGGLLAGFLAVENTSAITANSGTIAGFATHKTAGGLIWPVGMFFGPGSVTTPFAFTDESDVASVTNGAILADISATANAGYIKCLVGSEVRYIALYALKAS